MKNEEVRYNRGDIKRNTLAKEIFRIDFYALDSFEEILEKLEKYFKEKNYTYNQYNNYNINFELDDPEPLITESFMLKKNVEVIQNYEFINVDEACKFIVNQNMLIFDKGDFNNYSGVEKYFELFIGAINVINSISPIKLSRIGIRKINEIILSEKVYVEKYFNNKFLSDLSKITDETKEMIFEYSFRPFYNEESISLNKNIRIIKGKFKTTDGVKKAYSFVWDIDCYKRFNVDCGIEEIDKLCEEINLKIFDEYSDVISDNLYALLVSETGDDGVLGGLKNGAN